MHMTRVQFQEDDEYEYEDSTEQYPTLQQFDEEFEFNQLQYEDNYYDQQPESIDDSTFNQWCDDIEGEYDNQYQDHHMYITTVVQVQSQTQSTGSEAFTDSDRFNLYLTEVHRNPLRLARLPTAELQLPGTAFRFTVLLDSGAQLSILDERHPLLQAIPPVKLHSIPDAAIQGTTGANKRLLGAMNLAAHALDLPADDNTVNVHFHVVTALTTEEPLAILGLHDCISTFLLSLHIPRQLDNTDMGDKYKLLDEQYEAPTPWRQIEPTKVNYT